MATSIVSRHETPLSLYIALQEGERADLEVVGRAAIEWSRMIQEAAALADPFLEVRVELVSGTEGSINLNSMLHAVRGVVDSPKKLKAIAIGVAAFFAMEAGGWAINKSLDALWEWASVEIPALVDDLTDDDRAEVESVVTTIIESKTAQDKARRVYSELQRDQNVTGVGVSFKPNQRPAVVVPRSEFATRAGSIEVKTETRTTRVVPSRVTLTLVSPALADDDSKWRFRIGDKVLWAYMNDSDFRARIMPGSNSAPRMLIGIQMDVEMETTEELQEDGTWKVIEHHIVRVRGLREPPSQKDLWDSSSEDE